jgi:hypothetical protein
MILDLITSTTVAINVFFLANLHRRVKRCEKLNGWR